MSMKELIPGFLAVEDGAVNRSIKIEAKNDADRAKYAGMLKGVAYNPDKKVAFLEIKAGTVGQQPYAVVAYEKAGSINIVSFNQAYLRGIATWHLAEAYRVFTRLIGGEVSSVGKVVNVYAKKPELLDFTGWDVTQEGSLREFTEMAKAEVAKTLGVVTSVESEAEPTSEDTMFPEESVPVADGNVSKAKRARKAKASAKDTETEPKVTHPVFGELSTDESFILSKLNTWTTKALGQLLRVRRENQKIFGASDDQVKADVAHPVKTHNFVWFEGQKNLHLAFLTCLAGRPLGLVGEQGGGKEKLLLTLSYMLSQPIKILLCNGGYSEQQLEGAKELVAQDGMTVTAFEPGTAMLLLGQGYITVLDEVNTLDPSYTSIFHGVGNGDSEVHSMAGKCTFPIHPKANLAMAMNEGFEGTNKMNRAFMDRVNWIRVSRPESIKEILLSNANKMAAENPLASMPGDEELKWLDKLYGALMSEVNTASAAGAATQVKLTAEDVSIRGFVAAMELSSLGSDMKDALEIGLVNRVERKKAQAYMAEILDREAGGFRK